MQLGDLFAKLGQGEALTSDEAQSLRLVMNDLQSQTNNLSALGSAFGGIDASIGRFRELACNFGPHALIAVRLYDTGNFQSIATATETNVVFSELRALWGNVFSWDASNPTVINVRNLSESWLLRVNGSCVWQTNSTGYRYTVIAPYDANDVLLTPGVARTLTTTGAVNGVQTTYSYSDGIHRVPGVNTMSTIKLRVGQTSGGNLNLEYASCMLELIGSLPTP